MAQMIRDVMTTTPVCLSPTDTARDAADQMRRNDMGDVIVADTNGRIEGIVTDRDLVLRVMADGDDPSQVSLRDVETRDPATLEPGDSVDRAVQMMRDNAIRRIPVVEDGRPVGMVSLGDLALARDSGSALADISQAPPQD